MQDDNPDLVVLSSSPLTISAFLDRRSTLSHALSNVRSHKLARSFGHVRHAARHMWVYAGTFFVVISQNPQYNQFFSIDGGNIRAFTRNNVAVPAQGPPCFELIDRSYRCNLPDWRFITARLRI